MRRLLYLVSGTLLLLLAGYLVPGAGTPAAEAAPAPLNPAPHARGLLWKVESTGRAPSYVFGTIHLADPRVTALPPPVQQAFGEARHFLMELVPDADAVAQLAEAMIFADARTLMEIVGPALYKDVETAFQRRGIPTALLAKYKPWAVAVILSLPNAADGVPLDLQLQLAAAAQGKTVEGLETAREQIAVFNDLALEEQRALLEAALREQALLEQQIEALVQAYLARDLTRLRELAESHPLEDRALHDAVMRRLLADRNRRMVERMQPRLAQGGAFVAVGAAHLPGPEGVLALLESRGYRVRAVY